MLLYGSGVTFQPTPIALRALSLLVVALGLANAARAQEPQWEPWQLLLPFDHPEGDTTIEIARSPEDELPRMKLDGEGPDFEREHVGKKENVLRWFPLDEEAETSSKLALPPIKFDEHFPEELEPAGLNTMVAAYMYRAVQATEAATLPVEIGNDDSCRIWLNGALIFDINGPNAVSKKRKLDLDLEAGRNHLLVKVVNGGGAWGFQIMPKEVLTPEVRKRMQPAINDAIDLGVDYLLKTQQLDGSWGYSIGAYRNGQTSLSLYALLKSGVKPEHQAIQRGFEYLALHPPKKTYSNAVQILALAAAHRERDSKWMKELAKLMLDWQNGDFAYPGGQNDLSCTQYGAFAYWISAQRGIKIPKRAWVDLVKTVQRYANRDGGFGYRPSQESTGAMTVAGLTVLAVCKQSLEKGYPRQWRKDLEEIEERGMQWLVKNFEADSNPAKTEAKRNRWIYYYLYSLERLAALLQIDKIGAHDWYWEGAQFLLAAQTKEGNWGTTYGESEPNTAFALLFLNRATSVASGPGASRKQGRHYATDGEDALVVLRAKGDTPMSLWLSQISPALAESHSRVGEKGDGLYLEAVEYLADGESIARVEADPETPWSSQPYAIQHHFEARGDHEVQLKLIFAEVEGSRPEPALSPLLKVRVDARLEPWMLDYVNDRASNLALGNLKETDATSRRGDAKATGYVAAKAFDGLQSTAWMSQATDESPAISVEFKKAVRFDRLVLSHAAGREIDQGKYDRATKIEIEFIGKRDPVTFELDPSEYAKTTLMMDRISKTKGLTIRVLERVSGVKNEGIVGFSEIEFRLGEEKTKKR